ncbi:type III secretion system cytoplasmic ring protein SctQ [Photorhabdus luminescens]|uniref:YscQ/HrcQ family type III secretion apparatus protein n=1 Tax=Photorhabdus luminescens subsp. sonorensis TaxID=1173677 RepID=A0A5C4RMT0_PHOLU|nr:type III secretion system cytoplasmic ring protein SctQ [Photorhabdus luminescens]TNH45360.1 YscQ/HrcQ family type III secretion apparatus protein [Photorhabdus luminescens subsp. sonorensis]
MNNLTLSKVSLEELTLHQTLSRHQQQFSWDNNHLSLDVALPPQTLDRILIAHWQGQTFSFYCHAAELALWLAPDLQQANLTSLPQDLLLALLEYQSKVLPTLLWSALRTTSERPLSACLQLRLKRPGATLPLWLPEPSSLIAILPERQPGECLSIPLRLSLQWGAITLTLDAFRTLESGDVLLLPPQQQPDTPLLAYLEGRPWAYFKSHDHTLELITMHTPSSDGSDNTLPVTDLNDLEVHVSFEVGRQTLDLQTLTSLQPGSLLDLGVPSDGEVRILVNQKCLGSGRLVDIEGRLGVRVEHLSVEKQL